jgi:hypothetical protein
LAAWGLRAELGLQEAEAELAEERGSWAALAVARELPTEAAVPPKP